MQTTKQIEQEIKNTIEGYKLCNKKEKVLVALSGGKDSATTLYVLKKLGYNVEAFYLDLLIGDWSKKNLDATIKLCEKLKVKLHLVNIRDELGYSMCSIRGGIKSKEKLSNCMICGVIKRYLLNRKARELGAKKIATGHNLDDEIEVYFMNLLKANTDLLWGVGPQNGVTLDKKFVPRIKPLYFITNAETRKFTKALKLPVVYEKCPCSTKAGIRNDVRAMVLEFEKKNKKIKKELIKNMLELIKQNRPRKIGAIAYCEKCGEPSRNAVCKSCLLFEKMFKK
ncbi:MAG: ATP-binding protein [Candidatus ainarchaeum sp.]|nr:ATP-binding protein [Candidatus ainarchaeum sp.]